MRKYLIATLVIVASVSAIPVSFPDCPTEDSTYCLWDASERGNKQGQSFIAFGEGVAWQLK